MYDSENIFAKILRKDIESSLIFENDYAIAFNDIMPSAPIHVLIIPKGEFIDYADFIKNASAVQMSEYFAAITKVAEKLNIQDYRLLTNNGAGVGQTVFHFHMHLLAGKEMSEVL